MKHLLSILLIGSITLTQELTVEGDLNVTGNIQNQTIDSLQQVIADLQSQLSALQVENKLETRMYELDITVGYNGNVSEWFNLSSLVGFDLDHALITLVDYHGDCCSNDNIGFQLRMDVVGTRETSASFGDYRNGQISASGIGNTVVFNNDQIGFTSVNCQQGGEVNSNIKLAVTSQFPN